MSSRIEQIIEDIEEYVDSCKFQPLSSTKIVVNKEELEELLRELRMKTPDEIKRYQKIISNKDAILADAQTKAASLIADAQAQQTVPGGPAPPGKDLVEVDLAHHRPPGQLRLGEPAFLIELGQSLSQVGLHKIGLIFCDVLVQAGPFHQLLFQIVGGFSPHHRSIPLLFHKVTI